MKNSHFWTQLLDGYKQTHYLENDTQLAEKLGVSRSMISHVRAGRVEVPSRMKVELLDAWGWSKVEDGALGVLELFAGQEVRAKAEAGIKAVRKKSP